MFKDPVKKISLHLNFAFVVFRCKKNLDNSFNSPTIFSPPETYKSAFMIGSHTQGNNLMQDLEKEDYETRNNIFTVRCLTSNTPIPILFKRNNKVFRHLIVSRKSSIARVSVH